MDIKIEKLKIQFGSKTIFSDFSAVFDNGKITGLIAPSGWGKTTLLNWISENYKSVSYAWQDLRLIESETVFQNITLPLSKKETEDKKDFIEKTICTLELDSKKNQKVSPLSGGEKQRVNLARSLVFNSEILLLDEPFQNLDSALKIKIMDFIKELHATAQRTVIFVTHDKSEAEYMCDKIIDLSTDARGDKNYARDDTKNA